MNDERIKTVGLAEINFDHRWYFRKDTLCMNIVWRVAGDLTRRKDLAYLEVVDPFGEVITEEEFVASNAHPLNINWKVPDDAPAGWYFVKISPIPLHLLNKDNNGRLLSSLLPESAFYVLAQTRIVSACLINFFADVDCCLIGVPCNIELISDKNDSVGIRLKAQVINKHSDTISAFTHLSGDTSFAVFSCANADSLKIILRINGKLTGIYPVPGFNREAIKLTTYLSEGFFKYRLFCPEHYSASSGWFLLMVFNNDQLIEKRYLNTNKKLAFYADEIELKKFSKGIIRVFVYKQGGYKIADRSLKML